MRDKVVCLVGVWPGRRVQEREGFNRLDQLALAVQQKTRRVAVEAGSPMAGRVHGLDERVGWVIWREGDAGCERCKRGGFGEEKG